MRLLAFALMLSVPGGGAVAESAALCLSPEALLDATGGCEGNGVFLEASRACLAKLNAEEAAWGRKIEEHAKQAQRGQSVDTLAAREGYAATVRAMSHLHSLAEQGKAELLVYEPYLALPPLEATPLLAPDGSLSVAGAARARCYSDGLLGVRASQRDFDAKAAMYEARRKEALASAAALGAHLGELEALPGGAAPVKGRAAGANPVPAGKQKARESQITGKIRNSKLP